MKILISSSYKFIDRWDEIKKSLVKNGYSCVTPKDIDLELFNKYEGLTDEETKIAHDKYFEYLRNTDIIYVLNFDGYIGKSMMLEIGYAKGLSKKIYSIEEAEEPTAKLFIDKTLHPKELKVTLK